MCSNIQYIHSCSSASKWQPLSEMDRNVLLDLPAVHCCVLTVSLGSSLTGGNDAVAQTLLINMCSMHSSTACSKH